MDGGERRFAGLALALLVVSCGDPAPESEGRGPGAASSADPASSTPVDPGFGEDGRWAEVAAGRGATPHVFLIVVDTLRQDHLGCYGYGRSTTPRIDELAAGAARFERVLSQAPWTTPSIGALHSSRYPSMLGIQEIASVLRDEEWLLAEALKGEGYGTAAAVSHSFCSSKWGFAQGFDAFDESNIDDHFTISSPGVTDRGIEFVDAHRREHPEAPLFLWLHYFDPHFSYRLHEEHAYELGDYDGPVQPSMPFGDLVSMRRRLSERDLAEMRRLYDSEVALTDHHIGRFLDHLRAEGLYEDALVVFVADHGEEFMEHENLGHTKTVYSEVVEVPLLLKLPRAVPRVVTEPVMLVDVFPTILDYLDLAPPESLQGRSLLRAGERGGRALFSETTRKNTLIAVQLGDMKLIHDEKNRVDQLYDLSADPGERQDLRSRRPEELEELNKRLKRFKRRRDAAAQAAQTREISEEEAARLQALGYREEDDDEEGKDEEGKDGEGEDGESPRR